MARKKQFPSPLIVAFLKNSRLKYSISGIETIAGINARILTVVIQPAARAELLGTVFSAATIVSRRKRISGRKRIGLKIRSMENKAFLLIIKMDAVKMKYSAPELKKVMSIRKEDNIMHLWKTK
jgi:hypothetical protein